MKHIGWSLAFTLLMIVILYFNPTSHMAWFCFGWCCAFDVSSVVNHIFHKIEMRQLDRLMAVIQSSNNQMEDFINATKK